jgi:hypothetical protein
MKKITLILLILTACLKSFGQHPIGTDSLSLQTLANSNTLVKSKGAIGSDSGFVNAVYPDTASANLGKLKNYPGAQIRVADSIWLRNFNATKWLNLSAGSGATVVPVTWQNTLDNSSTLTHNNFSDMQGNDFFFDHGGVFTFNVNEFAIPYLATPQGNQDIFVGADEFGNLYKKQLVLPVDSGGFSGTQDWQSTIDQGNRMRHPNTVHFVNYDWYMDSLGNTSEFSGKTATFDNQVGAYTEKHQDSANAYLYAQDTTGIQGTEMRVHPDSAHMQAWDASGNNTYFTLFRKGTTRTFANVADTIDAPVVNFPQFHNTDTTSNQINIDQTGNLYWTNKSGVQVTTTNSLDIYHENVEWATSTNVGNINPASTAFPCSGSLSIEGTTVGDGDYIKFDAPVVPDYSQYNYLVFKISSKGTWASGRRLRLRWLNGSTLLGVGVNFSDGSYGFNSSITDSCQLIYIPLGAFGDITGADNLRIVGSITSSGTVEYFIDDIVLQYSAISPIIGGALTWDQTMRNSPDISQDYFSHFNSTRWTLDSILQLNIHVQNWVDIIGDKDAGREYMLEMHVNDAPYSMSGFANSTHINGLYNPLIFGYVSSLPGPNDNGSLNFRGIVDSANDYAGTIEPAIQLVGAKTPTSNTADPNALGFQDLVNKPLVGIGNATHQTSIWFPDGSIQHNLYGQGNFTGTLTYLAGHDASGHMIDVDPSSIAATETDAIALAKTITLNAGTGVSITGTPTQALSSNPSWTINTTGLQSSLTGSQGDMLYFSATNALANLAKSTTAHQFISSDGTSNNPLYETINSDWVTEGSTNKFYTDARARAAISVTGENYLSYNNTTGVLTVSAINLSNTNVTGNLGVSHLNSGTSASSSTFWRGDGTWATPASGGGNFWPLSTSTLNGTLLGQDTIISNTPSQLHFKGDYTTTANNQFYREEIPTITARGTVSDVNIGVKLAPTFVMGANTQTGAALSILPTWTTGAFSGTVKTAILHDGSIIPNTSNTWTLGTSAAKYNDIQTTNATISSVATLNLIGTTAGTLSFRNGGGTAVMGWFGADADLVLKPNGSVSDANYRIDAFGEMRSQGVNVTQIGAPSFTVTQQGTAGSTSYTYVVQGVLANGSTTPITTITTSTGNATLGASNFNRITITAQVGIFSYNVYRSVSSGTPSGLGLISNIGVNFQSTATPFADDKATTATGSVPTNTTDMTGYVSASYYKHQPYTSAQITAMTGMTAGDEVFCSDCTANDASTGVGEMYNGSVWKKLW